MNKILIAVLIPLGCFSQNRIGVFENQVSRTQHLNWEYVFTDSSSAFQDTIEGIERYFWTSGIDTVKKQIVYTYDYHSVLDGSIDYDLYRDGILLAWIPFMRMVCFFKIIPELPIQ